MENGNLDAYLEETSLLIGTSNSFSLFFWEKLETILVAIKIEEVIRYYGQDPDSQLRGYEYDSYCESYVTIYFSISSMKANLT